MPIRRAYAGQAFQLAALTLALATPLAAQDVKNSATELIRREWQVNGVAREALLYIPATAKTTPTPVVFAFHGHGGTMQNAARTMRYHTQWPEAISVYMQGLNTPGRLTDPEGKKPGWQASVGNQDDRDLAFFDAVLASLKQDYQVDARRIYSTGHSNGGGFTYLLWAARGEVLAAVAPSSAAAARQLAALKPKPVLHVAGESDPLVKYAWQQHTMEALRKLNGCDEKGTAWEDQKWCTLYASPKGTPVITYIHPGEHKFAQEAVPVIVKFFKQHALP